MNTHDKIIRDLSLYTGPGSILILDKQGSLERRYCPFRVLVIQEIHVLQAGQYYNVNAVRVSKDLFLLYVISNFAYPYHYFILI